MKERLLREPSFTLLKAMGICTAAESTKFLLNNMKEIANGVTGDSEKGYSEDLTSLCSKPWASLELHRLSRLGNIIMWYPLM